MNDKVDKLLKDSNKSFDKMIASSGCDLVTAATSPFRARNGKIWAVVVAENATRISSITEGVGGTETAVTSRSYIGAVDLGLNALIIFDAPVSSITLSAGSAWIYYS
jgi:hypothetical protein